MGAATKIREALAEALGGALASSGASIEQKIIDAVGAYADAEATERQNTLSVIRKAIAEQKVTSIDYYRKKASEYQQGDRLSYDPVNFGAFYETVDENKQIVKSVYIVGQHPEYTLLVNKQGDDGHLVKLESEELEGFRTYFSAFQPVGMAFAVNSLEVAKIYDPAIVIYVDAGVDANEAATQINANLLAAETEYRPLNAVTLSEIADTIQRFDGVRAVYFGNPYAEQTLIDNTTNTVRPQQGVFRLTTGAFTFATEITPSMIKVLE